MLNPIRPLTTVDGNVPVAVKQGIIDEAGLIEEIEKRERRVKNIPVNNQMEPYPIQSEISPAPQIPKIITKTFPLMGIDIIETLEITSMVSTEDYFGVFKILIIRLKRIPVIRLFVAG